MLARTAPSKFCHDWKADQDTTHMTKIDIVPLRILQVQAEEQKRRWAEPL